jgi:hypothetical protein
MTSRGERLSCTRGRMHLPEDTSRALESAFGEPATSRLAAATGQRWFCPRCATALTESEGDLACPRGCGSLNDLVPRLLQTEHWITC